MAEMDKSAPALCFVLHANGLCKGTLAPFVEELARHLGERATAAESLELEGRPELRTVCLGGRLHMVLVDLLGHGAARPLELAGRDTDWTQFARQLQSIVADCLRALPSAPAGVFAVGHSLGGGCALLAQALAEAQLFSHMFLFEPMYLFSNDVTRGWLGLRDRSGMDPMQSPFVQQALRRRTQWTNRADACAYLSRKPFYASWDPRALTGYFEDGLQGTGPVRLACSAETEANLFAGGAPRSLVESLCDPAGTALKGCRVSIAIGKGASSRGHEWKPEVASKVFGMLRPRAQISEVDVGHMWPVEHPPSFASHVAEAFQWPSHSSL